VGRATVKRTIGEIPHPGELASPVASATGEEWYVCGEAPDRQSQGWKLYVPMTMLNARAIVQRTAPLLVSSGLQFKYVRDLRTLCKLNEGTYGYSQVGKNLVIYLPEPDAAFVTALKRILQPFRDECPAVPCARPIGDRLPLYYRYGSYRHAHITIGGVEVVDDRLDLARAVPPGIEDALAGHCSEVPEDPAIAAFLGTFPVFRALRQQGKSGVFHCMNLASETFQEVVLKVGYHRGCVQPDGSDGCTLLRRELAFYRLLAQHGIDRLAPALVDALDVPRKVILALDHVAGSDLLSCKLDGRLTVAHLDAAWAMIEEIHGRGLFLGDAKLGNFLLGDDGRLRIVDFETAGVLGQSPPSIRTFLLSPPPTDQRAHDRAHFLASVLFAYERAENDADIRCVEMNSLTAQRPSDDVSNWALGRLGRAM
jgi:hypothetical protein